MAAATAKMTRKGEFQCTNTVYSRPSWRSRHGRCIMLIWLYATRIPAMQRAGVKPGQIKPRRRCCVEAAAMGAQRRRQLQPPDGAADDLLRDGVRVAAARRRPIRTPSCSLGSMSACASLHSLVQATVNVIIVRFSIFVVASVVLGFLIYRAAVGVGLIQFSF